VTRNVCEPRASPEYAVGDAQDLAGPPSSEHVVLVTDPVVVHANVADVEAGDPLALVMRTVGGPCVAPPPTDHV
jgi:hypothetical protein